MGAEITFAASSLGIVGMLFLKMLELRTGKPSLMSKWIDNTKVRATYYKVRRFISYFNKQNAILLLRFIIVHAIILYRRAVTKLKTFIMSYPSAQKMHDMITGKGVIKKKGAVSFFLKQMTDEAIEAEDLAK